jgi:hypothetical protein
LTKGDPRSPRIGENAPKDVGGDAHRKEHPCPVLNDLGEAAQDFSQAS